MSRNSKASRTSKVHRIIPGRPKTGVYLKCDTCGKEFYVYIGRVKTAHFCSMKCYDKTGDKNPFWGEKHKKETRELWKTNPSRVKFKTGEDNPNFVRFAENNFIGNTKGWWKRKLLKDIGACESCGYKEHKEILEIHHLDLNEDNNTRENLRLFCPNCHDWWHYQRKNGQFHMLNYFYRNGEKQKTKTNLA